MSETKKKIALLSNITVDLITAKLQKKYDFYLPEGFDTWVQEVINPESGLHTQNFDAVVVLLDGTESRSWKDAADARDRLLLWEQTVSALVKETGSVPVFVSTFEIREHRIRSLSERTYKKELENEWYSFVQNLIDNSSNVYRMDVASIINEMGYRQFYSNKMWYMSSMPYSRDGLNAVSAEISRVLSSLFEPRKKVVVLDLDNTLWGGVIGEDGLEGIELADHGEGQRYYDFQRRLLEMKKRGILLGINSKNNEEDASIALKHPAMQLKDDDFAIKKINWDDKVSNMKSIEDELNITESGFLFVDDNPVEREFVKGECPDACVPDFPGDTTELIGFAEDIWADHFRPLRILDEDTNKTRMYKEEAERRQAKASSLSIDDYIAKLEIRVDIHGMRSDEIDRVVQLCNKTNQFNLTTKRYTKAEIEGMNDNPADSIYVVRASDKYGDNGLISVVILHDEGEVLKIDTFLMSCRVMGRKIEHVIINELAANYTDKKKLIGEYIPTLKNIPVKDLFERLGFDTVSDTNGHKTYELDLTGFRKQSYDNYKEISFKE